MEEYAFLLPAHNPPYIAAMKAFAAAAPQVPSVALFETAFFTDLPEAAYTYAVPWSWREEEGIRRFGFHGASHRYASDQARRLLGRRRPGPHLLPPGRQLEPGRHQGRPGRRHELRHDAPERHPPEQPGRRRRRLRRAVPDEEARRSVPTTWPGTLSKESGLAGISGTSGDVRDLEAAAARGRPAGPAGPRCLRLRRAPLPRGLSDRARLGRRHHLFRRHRRAFGRNPGPGPARSGALRHPHRRPAQRGGGGRHADLRATARRRRSGSSRPTKRSSWPGPRRTS